MGEKKTKEPHVVKRKGHNEKFDGKKVYASVYWACKTTGLHESQSEKISSSVLKEVKKWLEGKPAVNSNDIFRIVSEKLEKLDKEVAYMYSTLRDIS